MSSIFQSVPLPFRPKRSKFDLSYSNKLTTSFGRLTPVLCKEVLPGDVFRHNHALKMDMAPFNTQLMQQFDVSVRYFYVPNRLIWDDWEDFMRRGDNGQQTFIHPYFTPADYYAQHTGDSNKPSTLADYLGLPFQHLGNGDIAGDSNLEINALPFRAYQQIYNDWYRDENLNQEVPFKRTSGQLGAQDLGYVTSLRRANYKKDYFTSALPFAQKGAEVTLPLLGQAPVKSFAGPNGHTISSSTAASVLSPLTAGTYNAGDTMSGESFPSGHLSNARVRADLSSANVATLNDWRTSYALETFLEGDALGGNRYKEFIKNHYNVRIPDYRLDRSEYIGGSVQPVTIGNVYSTNSNNGNNVQGSPVSIGTTSGLSQQWKYKVPDFGWILGILCVQPKASYFQGINRTMLNRDSAFDYVIPEFANLGEQGIKTEELYFNGGNSVFDIQTFGYAPRYAEYKYSSDEIHGMFRDSSNPLFCYTDARHFAAQPSLNYQFIRVDDAFNDLGRVFNGYTAGDDYLFVDIFHNVSALRCLPFLSNPKYLI